MIIEKIKSVAPAVIIPVVFGLTAFVVGSIASEAGYQKGMKDVALGNAECAVFVLNETPRAVCEKKTVQHTAPQTDEPILAAQETEPKDGI